MLSQSRARLQAYNVQRQIGKGSYGDVFLVTIRDGKKKYVMKNIALTSSSAKERLGAEQEAALLSRLQHPNIVSYKESFQDECSVLHIVMGYCEGGDLCSRLKTYGCCLLPETQVVEWFVQIALGLQYLHDRNILHRDLKTQNIFLSKNDIIKVGDLGIARVLDGSCDLAHTVVGTPYYMSPELFANQPYNHKSDIWALGCCVHEIASLKHAFSARSISALMYKVIQGKIPPIPLQYSNELVQLVQKMMERNADERPTVHQILRMSFIRKHIMMFLDRAAMRKRKERPLHSESKTSLQQSHRADETGGRSDKIEAKLHVKCLQEHTLLSSQLQGSSLHKVPRPLPPDPSPLAKKELSALTENVSSARQRRRKSKQYQDVKPKSSKTNDEFMEEKDGGTCDSDLQQRRVADDCPGNSDEVDAFFSLLSSTLHLPAAEPPPVEVKGDAKLASGRLAERIRALRLECETGLGVLVVQQIMDFLGRADPEEAEEDLKLTLGENNFELYAAKLQQLKLCEESLFSH